MGGETLAQMPKYKCHKEVWALKISKVIEEIDGTGILEFSDARFAPRQMPSEYMEKHKPEAGGYLVQYEDGYLSWSPAEAFEGGYTQIPY